MSKYYLVFYSEWDDMEFSMIFHATDELELQRKIDETRATLLTYELIEDY